MMFTSHKNIVLASGSPRRKELMSLAGFQYTILAPDIDENNYPGNLAVEEVPEYLAVQKAKAVHQIINNAEVIIVAADSMVYLDGRMYGKPQDKKEAMDILAALSNQTHTVLTGLCILGSQLRSKTVSTLVSFNPISVEEIDYYIEQYKPFDKAGAYGIQDWIGWCKVKEIKGSYSNIMGLPMETVYDLLRLEMN